jgi:hypothetical protein
LHSTTKRKQHQPLSFHFDNDSATNGQSVAVPTTTNRQTPVWLRSFLLFWTFDTAQQTDSQLAPVPLIPFLYGRLLDYAQPTATNRQTISIINFCHGFLLKKNDEKDYQ